MNKNVDGFHRPSQKNDRPGGAGIPRRPSLDNTNGSRITPQADVRSSSPIGGEDTTPKDLPKARQPFGMGAESDLPKGIDLDLEKDKKGNKRKYRKHWWQFWRPKEGRKKWSRKKKIIVWSIITVLLLALAAGGYFFWKFWNNTGDVFQGSPLQVLQNDPLQEDQYGRSNILLFGTSADDPNHPGADLTDSIMVISVDQDKEDAFMFSVPRDLWVKYDITCLSGYEGKINEVYMCAKDSGETEDEEAGQAALRAKVGEVFGMDLQYSIHVNYQVVQQSVEALGGVDIVIESEDPRGVLDRNFDWRCNYECHYVNWPNGPVHLNGEQALFLAQARNESGGYGLSRGNFDREANQRKIMIAAKEKASSIGFLANPSKVLQLMDSLGDNIKTNFKTSEVKTLVNIAKDTQSESIESISLIDQEPMILTVGTASTGASIVEPVAGIYNYTGLQAFIKSYQTGSADILKEQAVIDVLNSSSMPGLAQEKADILTTEGLTVGIIGNAAEGATGEPVKIYDLSNGETPATKKRLEEIFNVVVSSDPLPSGIESSAQFVIIASQ